MINLSQTYGEDAAAVKDILMMFSSPGKRDAEIVHIGQRKTGAELRDEGMALAMDHAEQACPGWGRIALDAVREFCRKHKGQEFQAEDVRDEIVIPPPPSERSWGPVMTNVKRLRIAFDTGRTAPVKNPTARCANAAVWIAA